MLITTQSTGLLHSCLTRPTDRFFPAHMARNERYLYVKSKTKAAPILCVAHADTVQELCVSPRITKGSIVAPGLDDRLGIFVCLMLEQLGIDADILITDLEEAGRSTAQYFPKDKLNSYNWIVEFDRGGEDAVTYDMDSPAFLEGLIASGFKIGQGSFSDVCFFEDCKVCAVNVGIGYYRAHAKDSYAKRDQLERNFARFVDFYTKHSNKRFEIDNSHYGSLYGRWDDWDRSFSQTSKGSESVCDDCYCSGDLFYIASGAGEGSLLCADCVQAYVDADVLSWDDCEYVDDNFIGGSWK